MRAWHFVVGVVVETWQVVAGAVVIVIGAVGKAVHDGMKVGSEQKRLDGEQKFSQQEKMLDDLWKRITVLETNYAALLERHTASEKVAATLQGTVNEQRLTIENYRRESRAVSQQVVEAAGAIAIKGVESATEIARALPPLGLSPQLVQPQTPVPVVVENINPVKVTETK